MQIHFLLVKAEHKSSFMSQTVFWLIFTFRYNTSDGMFNKYQQLVPIPPSTGPVNLKIEMEEDTVAAFYCENGCGGPVVENNVYRFGTCVSHNFCV